MNYYSVVCESGGETFGVLFEGRVVPLLGLTWPLKSGDGFATFVAARDEKEACAKGRRNVNRRLAGKRRAS